MTPLQRYFYSCLGLTIGSFGLALPIAAQERFDNQGVQFEVDTIIEFEFIESHGAYQSTFGVLNLETGERTPLIQEVKPSDDPENPIAPSSYVDDAGRVTDFLGTPGNAVPQPLAEFEFRANIPYVFYLESSVNGRVEETFYSLNDRNANSQQRLQFGNAIQDLANGGVLLRWDDTGSLLVMTPEEDRDFDDFLIRAGGHLACPFNYFGDDARSDADTGATNTQPTLPDSTRAIESPVACR